MFLIFHNWFQQTTRTALQGFSLIHKEKKKYIFYQQKSNRMAVVTNMQVSYICISYDKFKFYSFNLQLMFEWVCEMTSILFCIKQSQIKFFIFFRLKKYQCF